MFLCIYKPYLLYPSICVSGHLGCIGVLAVVNSAALNLGAHVIFLNQETPFYIFLTFYNLYLRDQKQN